jgi:AmmeMemoRadiSam system protein B
MSLATRAVYPTQPAPLQQVIDDLLAAAPRADIDGDLIALVVPDTNRLSGGAVSAEAFKLLQGEDLDTVVIVSPSHTGAFGRLSICQIDAYHTPLGEVPVNDLLRNELCDEDDDIFLDDTGHYHTEGADVQLPFLQRALRAPFDVVPIVMGEESPAYCLELGAAIGEVLYAKRSIVIGSADLVAGDDDALARFQAAVEAYNDSELMYLLGSETVNLEGSGAVITTLIAARHRGANRARVLRIARPEAPDLPGALACAFWRA